MTPPINTILQGDCIKRLNQYDKPFADLIFADPPFNIGYKYDVYEDKKAYDEYYQWTEAWMEACNRVLKPTGCLWIAIGAEYAAEVRLLGRKLGLTLRNWIIWHYTFGQNAKQKFSRAHTHLFYFVKDPKRFIFNIEATSIFSDREKEYKDKRANPKGRLPNDVWDEFPRVCGTFNEREGWHPCQMPEPLLARIIRTCSNGDDLVFDPFAGSGTTLVVAKKLNRQYLGMELSPNYVVGIQERLDRTTSFSPVSGEDAKWPDSHIELLKHTYQEMKLPSDRIIENRFFAERFTQRFNWRLHHSGDIDASHLPEDVTKMLRELRKRSELPKIRAIVTEKKD